MIEDYHNITELRYQSTDYGAIGTKNMKTS